MFDCVSLFGVLFLTLFFLLFFHCNLLLDDQELVICFLEFSPCGSSSLFSLHISQFLPLELFLDLLFNEFSLKLLLLQFLDIVELEVFKLILDVLGVLHFFVIFFFKFLSETLIVFFHLLFFKLFPLEINFLLELCFSSFSFHLLLLFLNDIAHEHLGVKGLNHISIVVELLIGFGKLCLSETLLIELLFSVDFSSFHLL